MERIVGGNEVRHGWVALDTAFVVVLVIRVRDPAPFNKFVEINALKGRRLHDR